MQTYTSVSGYTIKKSLKITPIDSTIIECFKDSITHEIMKMPIFLPITSQIYDKESIIKWFGTSNIDPLTGINIKFNEIKIIPIVSYFLFLLCVEKQEDNYVFHHPYGTVGDLFEIANKILNGYTLKNNIDNNTWMCNEITTTNHDGYNLTYKCKTDFKPLSVISLDLTDYYFEIVECNIIKNEISPTKIQTTCKFSTFALNQNDNQPIRKIKCVKNTNFPYVPIEPDFLQFLEIKDIIGTCVITKRALDNNCFITSNGYIISSINANNNEKSQGYVCGSLFAIFHKEQYLFTHKPLFAIIHNIIKFSDKELSIPLFNYNSDFPKDMDKETQLSLKDYNNILNMNVIYLNKIQLAQYSRLCLLWEEKHNKGAKDGDFYISCTSTHKKLHNFYLAHVFSHNKGIANKISDIVNDSNFVFKGCGDAPINKMKEQLDFPVAGIMTYGDDFSFLTIENKVIRKDFKGDYFIGTQFINCTFIGCSFSCCSFTESIYVNSQFKQCTFKESSMYKMGKAEMIGCKADSGSLRSLKGEF